jgi:hypothetical protein
MGQQMSEVFWAAFVTTIVGFLLAIGKFCYKSKCSQIEICCIKITRNIDAELREDLETGDSTKNNEETKR